MSDSVTTWRNQCAKRANAPGRYPRGQAHAVVHEDYVLAIDGVILGAGLTLEVALDRLRLDALSRGDLSRYSIERMPKDGA